MAYPSVPPVPPAQPYPIQNDKKGLAVASLVLGIVAILSLCLTYAAGAPFMSVIGTLCSIAGLVLGIMGVKSSGKGMAIAGIIICGLILAVGLFMIVTLMLLGPIIGNVFTKINSGLGAP